MRARIGLVVVALLGSILFVPTTAAAQTVGPSCKGEEATVGPTLVPGGVPTFAGTSGDDVIVGTSGADRILGRGGDDLICALGGPDEIQGGSGNDRIYAGAGKDEVRGGKGRDLIVGGRGGDDIWGNSGRDRLRGNKGHDNIRGGSSADVLRGAAGDDTLRGGGGIDDCDGGSGANTLTSCEPTALTIADLSISQPVLAVGLQEDGAMEVPDVEDIGWYRHGAVPGRPGATVFVAHVSWGNNPGPFSRLGTLEPGALIDVDVGDTVHSYVVVERTVYDKDALPPSLWRNTGPETLALITCGGDFNNSTRRYKQNIVVLAVPVAEAPDPLPSS